MLTDSAVNFSVGYWRKVPSNYFVEAWKDNRFTSGKYLLELKTANIPGIDLNASVNIELRNDLGELLNPKQQIFQVRDSMILVPFQMDRSLLNISLKSISGSVGMSSFLINKTDPS